MSNAVLEKEILDQLGKLSLDQLRRVLDFARDLAGWRPAGVPGKELLAFAGAIDHEDLDLMKQAIEDGCETVDLNGW